jgi:hypothetical protein
MASVRALMTKSGSISFALAHALIFQDISSIGLFCFLRGVRTVGEYLSSIFIPAASGRRTPVDDIA